MSTSVKATLMKLSVLLFFCNCANSLIVPEELPTVLSLIYSNLAPIKKGTDSRVGIGFRLGEHADVQFIVELGPQTYTQKLGNTNEVKRRRDVMYYKAIKGEMGPLAQAVAKYQTERRIQKELQKLKELNAILKKKNVAAAATENQNGQLLSMLSDANLNKPHQVPLEQVPIRNRSTLTVNTGASNNKRIDVVAPKKPQTVEEKFERLTKLYDAAEAA